MEDKNSKFDLGNTGSVKLIFFAISCEAYEPCLFCFLNKFHAILYPIFG